MCGRVYGVAVERIVRHKILRLDKAEFSSVRCLNLKIFDESRRGVRCIKCVSRGEAIFYRRAMHGIKMMSSQD